MQIRKLNSANKVDQLLLLLYGSAGVGKTYSAIDLFKDKDYVLINIENRLNHLLSYFKDINVLQMDNMSDFSDLTSDDTLIHNKYVIVDSISSFYDMLIAMYSREKNKEGKLVVRDMTPAEWGMIARKLTKFFTYLKTNAKGIIFTCREKPERDGDRIIGYIPDIGNKLTYGVNSIILIYYDKDGKRKFQVKKEDFIPTENHVDGLLDFFDKRKQYDPSNKKENKVEKKDETTKINGG
jgi:hypothetical protein